MNKSYFCQNLFLIDWRHKHVKNTIDLLLIYREHFYGFSERDLWKRWKKKHLFHNSRYLYIRVTDILKFYEVLFCTYCKGLFCLKKQSWRLYSSVVYIPPYMHKTLSTLGNVKSNFAKIRRASWFSRGRLKILKCSISLAQLGKC